MTAAHTYRISRRAAKTWKRLTDWYGARLAESYGPTCPEDWCDLIDRTDDERLQLALLTVKRDHLHHPPTLGEFEAAVPRRQHRDDPGPAMTLATYAVEHLQLCPHQLMRPWNYFGPDTDFPPRKGRPEQIQHPLPRGVWIPPCEPCERPAERVLLEQAERSEDAA